MIYTDSEQFVRKYTVNDAVNAAKFILFDKYKIRNIKIDIKRPLDEKITLKELNILSDKIVSNTL